MSALELPGIEPDNLLAFLALLGLLRALECTHAEWQARIVWGGPPWKASLETTKPLRQREVAAAAHEGLRRLAPAFRIGAAIERDWTIADFRAIGFELVSNGDREATDFLAALASDGYLERRSSRKEKRLAATALWSIGTGQQRPLPQQLARVRDIVSSELAESDLAGALFLPWQYTGRRDAVNFRWDPAEDRRYAYRYENPSNNKPVDAVPGANLLAALGFPLFSVAPTRHDLLTLSFGSNERRNAITWPLWSRPLTVVSIRALLTLPELTNERPDRHKVMPYGVVELMRARRTRMGDYVNFSRAAPLWGAASAVAAGLNGESAASLQSR
jgi:hypothetical protein